MGFIFLVFLLRVLRSQCWLLPFCHQIFYGTEESMLAVTILSPDIFMVLRSQCWLLPFCHQIFLWHWGVSAGCYHFVTRYFYGTEESVLAVTILSPDILWYWGVSAGCYHFVTRYFYGTEESVLAVTILSPDIFRVIEGMRMKLLGSVTHARGGGGGGMHIGFSQGKPVFQMLPSACRCTFSSTDFPIALRSFLMYFSFKGCQ
jgi:hypothetical protein